MHKFSNMVENEDNSIFEVVYVLHINSVTNIMLYARGAKVHSDFVPRTIDRLDSVIIFG